MDEVKLVKARLEEKAKLRKAQKQITRLFVVSSCLIFFTLFFVWLIKLPSGVVVPEIYYTGTMMIIFSSVALYFSQRSIRLDRITQAARFTLSAIFLGITFGAIQLMGWPDLVSQNEGYQNILLPFSLIHFGHILVGLVFLFLIVYKLRNFEIHSRASHFSSNVFYFWHFLGVVWLSFLGILL